MAMRVEWFLCIYVLIAVIAFTAGCPGIANSTSSANQESPQGSGFPIGQPLTGNNTGQPVNISGENVQPKVTTMETPAEILPSESPTTEVTILPTPTPPIPTGEPFDVLANFIPSGWMGNLEDVTLNEHENRTYHSPDECVSIMYSAAAVRHGIGWAGIYWQYPAWNWGNKTEGINLKNYNRLSFWARGENGGEIVEFKVGGIDSRVCYPDSQEIPVSSGLITLTQGWRRYQIDLSRADLSHTIGGFCWVAEQVKNPRGFTFYLDDVYFEADEDEYGSQNE